ncbi:hypothetical protein R6Q57_000944 [Mikania cordata]
MIKDYHKKRFIIWKFKWKQKKKAREELQEQIRQERQEMQNQMNEAIKKGIEEFMRTLHPAAYTFITDMDEEMPHQEEVAQQGSSIDPETLALSQHEWLQFEPQSAAVHARAILGEDTAWTRLFELAELPLYRLITVEFLSTFIYRAHQAAVREEDDEELPPDIEFSLGGQHFEMSIERFVVHLGIYYAPETVRDDFAQGFTQGGGSYEGLVGPDI